MRRGPAISRSPRDEGGAFTQGTVHRSAPYSPVHGISFPHSRAQGLPPPPSLLSTGGATAHSGDPRVSVCPSFLSNTPGSASWHRVGWNCAGRFYPSLPPGGFRTPCVFPVAPPLRLRVSQYRAHTFLVDDTRPPWGTQTSSPPCRPHTPWYDGEEPRRLRLHRAGSTMPRLWPTGSSVGWLPWITTRWCSARPSAPLAREAPCPPKDAWQVAPGPPWRYPAFAFVPV
jgi:hypothetical protein